MQGVGLGLILLQTLSRLHVTVTLAFSQIIGAIVVIIARATAPDSLGAGTVFPDAGIWDPELGLSGSPIASPMFWLCLVCQLIIVVGYFWFYRREELGELITYPRCFYVANCLSQHDHNLAGNKIYVVEYMIQRDKDSTFLLKLAIFC